MAKTKKDRYEQINRFEKDEMLITELNEKMDSLNFRLKDELSKSMKGLREEISEDALSKAIAKLSEEKEIRVNSRALDELKDI